MILPEFVILTPGQTEFQCSGVKNAGTENERPCTRTVKVGQALCMSCRTKVPMALTHFHCANCGEVHSFEEVMDVYMNDEDPPGCTKCGEDLLLEFHKGFQLPHPWNTYTKETQAVLRLVFVLQYVSENSGERFGRLVGDLITGPNPSFTQVTFNGIFERGVANAIRLLKHGATASTASTPKIAWIKGSMPAGYRLGKGDTPSGNFSNGLTKMLTMAQAIGEMSLADQIQGMLALVNEGERADLTEANRLCKEHFGVDFFVLNITPLLTPDSPPDGVHGNVINIDGGNVTGIVTAGNVGHIGNVVNTRFINTEGGANVEGNINVSGGNLVMRDQVNIRYDRWGNRI
ncbi:hypothetical protein COX05_04800 [candidate division WWE3 bacterium CG22_combo_CG10-13_8_21_14_all_39_12]|uniref:Uncharacterized protein n=1 Tax=candidate division WWE3 bacterium CG22_combo_CG10-13_8_21_14_all_39_12 TaxID=1975094 RepID=A0A2H0BER1_UNCKA|nr:MAG: hypothetical protein COX05_04800 [candidate division WWE3 bacterium CG22_combo_CG10-13_8_21_14_all_39_12]